MEPGVVDPIIRENPGLMGAPWTDGRVSWDGHCLTVEAEEQANG